MTEGTTPKELILYVKLILMSDGEKVFGLLSNCQFFSLNVHAVSTVLYLLYLYFMES